MMAANKSFEKSTELTLIKMFTQSKHFRMTCRRSCQTHPPQFTSLQTFLATQYLFGIYNVTINYSSFRLNEFRATRRTPSGAIYSRNEIS